MGDVANGWKTDERMGCAHPFIRYGIRWQCMCAEGLPTDEKQMNGWGRADLFICLYIRRPRAATVIFEMFEKGVCGARGARAGV